MFKVVGIMGIVLAVVLGGFYWYYKDSQDTIATLQAEKGQLIANVATLTNAINTQKETIDQLVADIELANTVRDELDKTLSETRAQNRQLVDRLAKHEIGALAASRPGLVENAINNATENAARCFEIISGAPLTESELNAQTPREFNSECPWLFDDLAIGR